MSELYTVNIASVPVDRVEAVIAIGRNAAPDAFVGFIDDGTGEVILAYADPFRAQAAADIFGEVVFDAEDRGASCAYVPPVDWDEWWAWGERVHVGDWDNE